LRQLAPAPILAASARSGIDVTLPEPGAYRVLLVDDDRELCAMLGEYLAADGFEVQAVHDGAAAVAALAAGGRYSIIVMDISMPRMDGFEALRELRRSSAVPVVMLTARGDDTDRIVGLELGADDYLPKPFNPRELVARLRAVLRRTEPRLAGPGERLRAGPVVLDLGARRLELDGQPIELTSTEFSIMEELARHAGEVVDKDQLSRQALGRRLAPFDRSLDTHVSNLRRKLGAAADGSPRIRTVRGRGYVLTTA
jgi:two-component system response regulator CpxR